MQQLSVGISHIRTLTGVPCILLDTQTKSFVEDEALGLFCHQCKECDYLNTHLYGCGEARRWGGKYIYYCHRGLVFLSNICGCHSIVTGPIDMESESTNDKKVVLLSTGKVGSLSEILSDLCSFYEKNMGEKTSAERRRSELLNALYEDKNAPQSEHNKFLISYEKELRGYILLGDKKSSGELLNKVLGKIYFSTAYNLDAVKARVIELIVILSRGAIEGGADIEQVFGLNDNYIKTVNDFSDLEDLSLWLTDVIHNFIGCVFDFGKARHSDVLYKVINYLNCNYTEKITLDDVASHVYLSRTYLSKIFKEEIGDSFTNYINNLRIDKSKQYLLDERIPLVDVANLVGFDDQSYFSKVFKKIVGTSPMKYRESRGK